jgi:membrane dipeptidase
MTEVFDLHNDLPTRGLTIKTDDDFLSRRYGEYSLHKVISVFWTTKLGEPLDYIQKYIKKYPQFESRLYAVEDLCFVKNARDVFELSRLPIIYAGLTWNGENALAGGTGSDSGLTGFGKETVKILETGNILIDTAHLNEKSFFDVLDAAKNVFCSHACLRSVFPHERNLTDVQIKSLIERGGIIGLTAVAQFMGKPQGMGERADYLRQIDGFVQKFGIKSCAVGTDLNGTDPVAGLSGYFEFELLKLDLTALGYKTADIDGIFYFNAENFFKKMSANNAEKISKTQNF